MQTSKQLGQTELKQFSLTSPQVIILDNDRQDFMIFRTLFLIMITMTPYLFFLLYLLLSERYRNLVLVERDISSLHAHNRRIVHSDY